MMTTIYNGAVLLRVNPFWTRILVGVILVVTVAVDQWRKRRSGEEFSLSQGPEFAAFKVVWQG